ncbi:hypothetical protein B0T10DRAFT_459260 [Thelonectria olida]|uniref:WSC domain-containing protein n=1 Tax=Thelonectria olida TaxID=1576542 RepID=A0A9P8W857_9HYPO|nr:hypothetical protein B0T10DRAFT_459260 [Thelonectria olida]
MFTPWEAAPTMGFVFLLASSWSPCTSALDLNMCASINTGSTSRNTSIYQSNGLCHDFCIDDYAYAITQNNACWCSNYAPSKSTREDVSDCDTTCPGYPSEYCGGDSLYGYLSLGNVEPSGTQGASSSSTTSKSESEESSTASTTTEQSSRIQTVTADGTVKTVFIAPTDPAETSAGDSSGVNVKKKGLSTGAVVGIVVGVIAAVIGAAAIALFFWFRRRKQQKEDGFQDDPSIRDSSSGPRPNVSMAGASPISPIAASKRNSTLQVDPRMDPFKQGLYVRSGSHESINTLRDEHDYSRRIQAPKVLRATNPDPDP